MKRRYFVMDITKCIGCFNCFHACRDEHLGNDWSPISLPQTLHGQPWLTTTEHVRGQHPMVAVAYITEPCNHCERALCVEGGQGAIYRREDGIVVIDPVKARGMGDMSALCPYGRISYNPEQQVSQKCTFCAHLLDEGWEQPRCVQACPLPGAWEIRYCEPEEMAAEAEREGLAFAHPELAFTGPSVYYKNLHRLNSMFLGGSVVRQEAGRDICFVGCTVVLKEEDREIARQETDEWGEFKFDGLRPGCYTIFVEASGFAPLELVVELTDSRESHHLGILRPEERSQDQVVL